LVIANVVKQSYIDVNEVAAGTSPPRNDMIAASPTAPRNDKKGDDDH